MNVFYVPYGTAAAVPVLQVPVLLPDVQQAACPHYSKIVLQHDGVVTIGAAVKYIVIKV